MVNGARDIVREVRKGSGKDQFSGRKISCKIERIPIALKPQAACRGTALREVSG